MFDSCRELLLACGTSQHALPPMIAATNSDQATCVCQFRKLKSPSARQPNASAGISKIGANESGFLLYAIVSQVSAPPIQTSRQIASRGRMKQHAIST